MTDDMNISVSLPEGMVRVIDRMRRDQRNRYNDKNVSRSEVIEYLVRHGLERVKR